MISRKLLILMTLCFQAACSDSGQPENNSTNTESQISQNQPDNTKPLYWAVGQSFYPPFAFRDKQGALVGLDIDLLNAIAEKEDIQITFMPQELNDLWRKLDENSADIALGGLNITAERQQHYAFTQAYLSTENAVLLDTSKVQIKNFAELKGKMIGVINHSAYENIIHHSALGQVKTYANLRSGISGMKNGEVAAVYDNERVLSVYHAQEPDVYLLKDTAHRSNFGFALRKDNPLLKQKLDKGLATIREDGTYDKILAKWNAETIKHQIQ
ncbi:ABC transporter substrate-binding protein [Wielerella bovis]|uniref:substrate-binding periplasmic protein n=1 Tax=Wielerella bovis TaxID=2917790 RepID=UPI00201A0C6B|nr:transporter substrate-binding domain-containing protein [Wielerella bovis]ULJ61835.1 ABC transporter substrate-binding protein [Wielerella bovis]